jgi:hypothetical protein
VAALGVTGYARLLGKKLERAMRRVMVREGRLCAATVAAPQGGKR